MHADSDMPYAANVAAAAGLLQRARLRCYAEVHAASAMTWQPTFAKLIFSTI